jgi:glycosyltransferase involved in cell wall biosynthesis
MLTFNRENLVGRMIECVLGQSFRDFEFIIVDNGSSDDSGKIADDYANKYMRAKVIHREKGNIGSGRNAGLDAANGEYIAFVDDDDTCTPDYLQFLYDLAVDNGADASVCGATWADFDEKRIMSPEEAIEILLWRKRYNVAFPTKLFRRDLFDNNRFLETGKYDDIYLMPKILANANKIAYHGLSKYHFNRHGSNNSAWTQNHKLLDLETLQEYLDIYRERTAWLIEKFPDCADKWRYFNWSFMLSMLEKVTRLELVDCFPVCGEMLTELSDNRAAFLDCGLALDFEKEWMNKYVNGGVRYAV